MRITEEIRKEIIALHKQGNSRVAIKSETGVSLPSIRKILREEGYGDEIRNGEYGKKPATEDEKAKLIELYNNGHTAESASELLGYSKGWALSVIAEQADNIKGRGESVSPALFIKTWQESTNLTELCEKLDLARSTVLSRGWQYMKKGIPLKRLRTKRENNWDELAELAQLLLDEYDD